MTFLEDLYSVCKSTVKIRVEAEVEVEANLFNDLGAYLPFTTFSNQNSCLSEL